MAVVFRSFSRLRISVAPGFTGDNFLLARPVTPGITRRPCSNVQKSKQMRKMLDRGPKKKWYASPVGIHPSVPSGKKKGFNDGQIKRANHISRVLYQYITDIINSGEVSPFLAEKAVEIVRVQVVPDLSSANVYWLSSGTKEDGDIERELKHNEGRIRQVLTSMHLLGRVPFLTFVKDARLAGHQKVLELLKTADMGPEQEEEYVALGPPVEDMGYPAITSGEISPTVCEPDILGHTDSSAIIAETGPAASAGLRSDIYGVPRDKILKKLQMLKRKRRPEPESKETEEESADKPEPVWAWRQPKLGRKDYTWRDYWREGNVRTQQKENDEEDSHNRR